MDHVTTTAPDSTQADTARAGTASAAASTGAGAEPARPVKRLLRAEHDTMIGGVCAGVASYLGVDANAVRALAVLATFFSAGAAAVAYVAFWLLLPTE